MRKSKHLATSPSKFFISKSDYLIIFRESLEKYKELLPNKQSKDEEDDDEDDEEKKKKEEGTATEEDKAKDASKKKEKDKDAGSGKLKGRTFELVSKAFKVLSGKKITIPNNYKR